MQYDKLKKESAGDNIREALGVAKRRFCPVGEIFSGSPARAH